MKTITSIFPGLLFAFVIVSITTTTQAEIGLVKDKPTDGQFVKTDRGYMIPYTATVPVIGLKIEMTPVPGGTVTVGSPESEENRNENEGPQAEVIVEPFWMGKYEITWGQYMKFMEMCDIFLGFQSYSMREVPEDKEELSKVDTVTAPSALYDESVTFANGDDPELPAVSMSQFAARQFTKWLSGMTGQEYRLPAEVEWEHAARAGSKTAYFFGDDPEKLEDYANFFDNSDEPSKVGKKKPNSWGLYDMAGNVAEITLDQYAADAYKKLKEKKQTGTGAVIWPKGDRFAVVRGGSYEDDPENCRSASRRATEMDEDGEYENWKTEEPNFPVSPWWFSDDPTLGIGFRIIRPLKPMTDAEKKNVWEANDDDIIEAAENRMADGRGAQGLMNKEIHKDIEILRKKQKEDE